MDRFERLETISDLQLNAKYISKVCERIINYDPEDEEEWRNNYEWNKEVMAEYMASINDSYNKFVNSFLRKNESILGASQKANTDIKATPQDTNQRPTTSKTSPQVLDQKRFSPNDQFAVRTVSSTGKVQSTQDVDTKKLRYKTYSDLIDKTMSEVNSKPGAQAQKAQLVNKNTGEVIADTSTPQAKASFQRYLNKR